MKRVPRIASVLLLLLVAGSALATDYSLAINATWAQLGKAKALHVYGFKFAKGDRVVAVTAGRQGETTGYRVTLDANGASGTMIADQNAIDGFPGKVLSASGQAPTKSFSVAIEKVAAPVKAQADSGGFGSAAKGFLTSPAGYITFSALFLLFVGAYMFRPKSAARDSFVLPNRRKAIDESLKEIAKRIEEIDAHQHELVKKPPVLRTFRNQINDFEIKLKQLEGQLNSVQNLLVKTGESLGSLDHGQQDIKAGAEANGAAVKGLAGSVATARQSIEELNGALQQLGTDQSARAEEILATSGKHALDLQNRVAGLESGQQRSEAKLQETTKGLADQIQHLKQGDGQLQASLAKLDDSLAKVKAGVDENLRREVDLSGVHASIAEFREVAENLQREQESIGGRLAELATKEVDLSGVHASIAEFGGLAASLLKEQESIGERLNELAAKEVDLSSLESAFAELKGLSEAARAEQAKLADQLKSVEAKAGEVGDLKARLAEVRAIVDAAHSEQNAIGKQLAGLAGREIDLSPVQAAIEELRGMADGLQQDQAAVGAKLADLGEAVEAAKPQSYEGPLQQLSEANREAKAAIDELAGKLDLLTARDHEPKLKSLAEHQSQIEANLNGLRSKFDKLEFPSYAKELGELAAQHKQQVEAQQRLAKLLGELQEASATSAAAIEAKIADVSARTDQRESILLSLQSRVADSEGKTDGSEILPMIADLRLELQSLASDQAKVGTALEGLSHSISKSGADAGSGVSALVEDQAKLRDALKEIADALETLRAEAAGRQEAIPEEEPKVNAAIEALAASLADWKAESDRNQRVLESRLAAAIASAEPGVNPEAFAIDQSGLKSSLDSLSESLAQWKAESDADRKGLEGRLVAVTASAEALVAPQAPSLDESKLEALAASLEQWKHESEEGQRLLAERLVDALEHSIAAAQSTPAGFDDGKLRTAFEGFEQSLAQWKSENDTRQNAFEERISSEFSKLTQAQAEMESKAHLPEPAAPSEEVRVREARHDPIVIDLEAMGAVANPEEQERTTPVLHLEINPNAIEAEQDSDGPADAPSQNGWGLLGGSSSRRWSAPLEMPVVIAPSDKPINALTPIVNPGTDYRIGPVVYSNKKVLYGHGSSLRGMWPGKGESVVQLQEEMPAEPWRVAVLDGHAFCVEEDQVELVNLASWHVVSRFSGVYVDQICTETHWMGLVSSMNQVYLDSRNLLGRQLAEPIRLPIKAGNEKAMAAEGERVFLGTKDAKLYRVELGVVKEIAAGEKGDELLSLSTTKNGLILLVRNKDHDTVRLYNFDGKLQKQLSLTFKNPLDHGVVMSDRIYLADAKGRKLVAFGLKKLEVAESFDLPGDQVTCLCGIYNGDQHAVLVSVGEKDRASGNVIALDTATGAALTICEVNEKDIQVIAADSRIVVTSSCFYQNMIRVFDPFKEARASLAA